MSFGKIALLVIGGVVVIGAVGVVSVIANYRTNKENDCLKHE